MPLLVKHSRRLISAVILTVALLLSSWPSVAQTSFSRRLVEVADLSGPIVSPDGKLVAFRLEQASIERNTYDSTWYVQRLDGGSHPRRVGDGGMPLRDSSGESLPAVAIWSPDGRHIYYRAVLDGRVDVWRAAADGTGAEALTFDAGDVRAFSLTNDGRALRFSVGATREEVLRAEQNEYDHGIRIDETVPVGAGLFRSKFIDGRLATQRYTGSWFVRGSLLGDVPDRWREIDLTTGERRELSSSDLEPRPTVSDIVPEGAPTPSQFAIDPHSGRIALLTSVEREDETRSTDHVELSIRDGAGTSRSISCLAEPCVGRRITSLQWRPGSDELLFTVTDRQAGHAQSIFRWNVTTGIVALVVQSKGLVTGGRYHYHRGTCGASADALVCVAAEADRPPRLERIDIESGQRHVLFDPNAALAADLADRISSRLLHWTDERGQEFTGHLFVAKDGETLQAPLFVTYYLCTGFLRGGMGDEWPLASLAEAGIPALCINAAPHQSDPVARYDAGYFSVASAIEMLASKELIDPARVGMGGLSFGSEVTLWVAVESDLLAAASVTSPSSSPLYFLMNSLKGETFLSGLRRSWGMGSPQETPERWERMSPFYNLDRIRVPILFQMPEEEYIHALDYTIPLMLRQQADLYVFPDEPHQKVQPRHKAAAYQRNLDWFRFWLQGFEDDGPRKVEQYKRWRLMRASAAERSNSGAQDGS